MNLKSISLLGVFIALLCGNRVLSQELIMHSIPDDNRFAQESFSEELFWQIPHGVRACEFYVADEYCSFVRQHFFSDAVLITEKDSTAYIATTLIPSQPISQQQALFYADILDEMDAGEIDFSNPTNQPGMIRYHGCPFVEGPLCGVDFELTLDEMVSRITIRYESP